jgi:hypothetical protein
MPEAFFISDAIKNQLFLPMMTFTMNIMSQ